MATEESLQEIYTRFSWKKTVFILVSLFLLFLLVLISVTLGTASIGIKEAFAGILSNLFPSSFQVSETTIAIIWKLRLPRICMAIAAGTGLAVAGVTMQNILRNPLASPYTLGIASGAGFGAALAIVTGAGVVGVNSISLSDNYLIIVNSFFFAMLPALAVLGLTKYKEATHGTLVLAGVAMMYLFSSGLSLLQYFGGEEEVHAIVHWLFGSLAKSNWFNTGIVTLITLISIIPLMIWSWDFNALSAGDEVAEGLGVNVERIRIGGMMISSLITASAVCFLGTIGFIGLVAPHITRIVIGTDHRFLIPSSALVGSIILLASDSVARTILSPLVLPVGIITSLLGVPLFLYLIVSRRRNYW
ncbi:MAG: ABC-type Fe(3+)-siderophore transport system permease component [Candidatus Methanohalarchaeum thermophilum]|uniref:ABC-type Fe(3+)-siderophore transport system permease component n=1 Tax=Methanohalarchaeum thermophilum TaxID=1903181 RepID=A0A1Q6DVU4_METT1|nr:MAG: ABC-type Fe(3+)-siderophore transport system permease component [Candidatus Methanohalarchaeum thermophilum]